MSAQATTRTTLTTIQLYELKADILKAAKKRQVSMSVWMREAVKEKLAREKGGSR